MQTAWISKIINLFVLVSLVLPSFAVDAERLPDNSRFGVNALSNDAHWQVGDTLDISWDYSYQSILRRQFPDPGDHLVSRTEVDSHGSASILITRKYQGYDGPQYDATIQHYSAVYYRNSATDITENYSYKGRETCWIVDPYTPTFDDYLIYSIRGPYDLNGLVYNRSVSVIKILNEPHWTLRCRFVDGTLHDMNMPIDDGVGVMPITDVPADANGDFEYTHSGACFPGSYPTDLECNSAFHYTITRNSQLAVLDANFEFSQTDLVDDALNRSIDVAPLASMSEKRNGAVADGATRLILRYSATAPGTVTFAVQNGPSGGSLTRIDSLDSPVNVPTTLVDGKFFAFALYTVPNGLVDDETRHDIQFTASYGTTQGGETDSVARVFHLERPPILLVHGLWSSAEAWSGGFIDTLTSNGFKVYELDYANTNAASFAQNQFVLLYNPGGIHEIYKDYRQRGIAITKVDIIGHSMGGILARELIRWPYYQNHYNYNSGYVRHLITLGTPHLGSEFANLLVSLKGTPVVGSLLADFGHKIGHPVDAGAIDDLAILSPALTRLGQTDVPAYAIRSAYNDTLISLFDPQLGAWFYLFAILTGQDLNQITSLVFNSQANDLIVSVESQTGLLTSGYNPGPNFSDTHLSETTNAQVATLAADLLSKSDSDAGFASGFPAPAVTAAPQPGFDSAGPQSEGALADIPLVTLTAPVEGAALSAGATFNVQLTPAEGVNLSQVLVLTGDSSGILSNQLLTTAPYQAEFTIPASALGDLQILAVARDTDGNLSMASRTVHVNTTATLDTLTAEPSTILLTTLGATARLQVAGLFSDSVTREVTHTPLVQYISADPDIASITASGIITAVGTGSTQITVAGSDTTVVVPVSVHLNAPTLVGVSPSYIPAQTGDATLTFSGFDLEGATQLEILKGGSPDPQISVQGWQVAADGASLTVAIHLAEGIIAGPRAVVVTTPGGSSATALGKFNQLDIGTPVEWIYLPLIQR